MSSPARGKVVSQWKENGPSWGNSLSPLSMQNMPLMVMPQSVGKWPGNILALWLIWPIMLSIHMEIRVLPVDSSLLQYEGVVTCPGEYARGIQLHVNKWLAAGFCSAIERSFWPSKRKKYEWRSGWNRWIIQWNSLGKWKTTWGAINDRTMKQRVFSPYVSISQDS